MRKRTLRVRLRMKARGSILRDAVPIREKEKRGRWEVTTVDDPVKTMELRGEV
jgi:hypothetical protein